MSVHIYKSSTLDQAYKRLVTIYIFIIENKRE